MTQQTKALNEFHISRQSRDFYKFEETLYSISGNVVFSNFHAARVFAKKMNDRRDLINYPEQAIQAGQINAMGLIDEIMHLVIGVYREQIRSDILQLAYKWLVENIGEQELEAALKSFAQEFPPLLVYTGQISLDEYIQGKSDYDNGQTVTHREVLLEEMLMLWLANKNPANAPYRELFDDELLTRDSAYRSIISGLTEFFETQPFFGPDHQNLVEMLRSPAIAHPRRRKDKVRRWWGRCLVCVRFRRNGQRIRTLQS
jgi:hypothetical protein